MSRREVLRLAAFTAALPAAGCSPPLPVSDGAQPASAGEAASEGDQLYQAGGAAIALCATNQTVAHAGITLRPDQAAAGTGAAGAVRAIPFPVDELRWLDRSLTRQ